MRKITVFLLAQETRNSIKEVYGILVKTICLPTGWNSLDYWLIDLVWSPDLYQVGDYQPFVVLLLQLFLPREKSWKPGPCGLWLLTWQQERFCKQLKYWTNWHKICSRHSSVLSDIPCPASCNCYCEGITLAAWSKWSVKQQPRGEAQQQPFAETYQSWNIQKQKWALPVPRA